MSKQTIGFIGLGLIGGSIAKALRAKHPDLTLIAYNRSKDSLIEAMADGTINQAMDTIGPGYYLFVRAGQRKYPLSGAIKAYHQTRLYPDRCGKRENDHS